MWEVRGRGSLPFIVPCLFLRGVCWNVKSRDFDRLLYLVGEGYEYENSWSYTLMSYASFGSIVTCFQACMRIL